MSFICWVVVCSKWICWGCSHLVRCLEEMKLLLATFCVCVYFYECVWIHLCFPIKNSFIISVVRVTITLITLKEKCGKN